MKRIYWALFALVLAVPLAMAGGGFTGIDKIGNYLVAHFSSGDVQIPVAKGVTDGTSAPAGYVGEAVVTSTGSTQILGTGVTGDSGIINVGSVPLKAGTYLCWASCFLNSSGSGVYSKFQCGLSTANNSFLQPPTNAYTAQAGTNLTTSGINNVLATGVTALSPTTTTTYFTNADANATSNSGTTNVTIAVTCLRVH